ncbi:amidase domain-containing protein [Sulfobacillus harzensis]|uniref:Amidase domain-containing protein n=1 Tax=Sulfobacillus harzensis TaxID=2729629 RepID=A0A7Y0Q1I5_9FIRM|nr:amidase domain-containing protein [Sulfobacillus harzensis]NMP22128.1 amidase domain-containing protein [Sulfobacillus harzensis]
MEKLIVKLWAVLIIALPGMASLIPGHPALTPLTPQEQAVKSALLGLVTREDQAVLDGNRRQLEQVFLLPKAKSALRHAEERQAFLDAWSRARGLAFTAVSVSLRTPHITFSGPGRVRVFAVVSERYQYRYHDSRALDGFGLGIRHDYLLEESQGRWRIVGDDFTDPLDQNTRVSGTANPESQLVPSPGAVPSLPLAPGAAKAVAYADRYCGAAPGCQNQGFYNPAYNNFNGDGGDCTNFVSQALRAGGFRETSEWNYDRSRAEGSRAWTNARGLFDFLEGSGRATILAHGRFSAVARPNARYPRSAAGELRPGDIVSYIERGRAVHSAIVVGYDSHGVPVVDSHTSDRYHVPWDLGWDYRTYYYFWRVHYPTPKP